MADSPIRNKSEGGLDTRTRTGYLEAKWTQFRVLGTSGRPGCKVPKTAVSGVTPKPTLSTTPEKCKSGLDSTYTSACIPGLTRLSSPSRKLPLAHQVRASISVNNCWPTWACAPAEIVTFETRASNGA